MATKTSQKLKDGDFCKVVGGTCREIRYGQRHKHQQNRPHHNYRCAKKRSAVQDAWKECSSRKQIIKIGPMT